MHVVVDNVYIYIYIYVSHNNTGTLHFHSFVSDKGIYFEPHLPVPFDLFV